MSDGERECPRCWKKLIQKGYGWDKDGNQYEVWVCPECLTWMNFDIEQLEKP